MSVGADKKARHFNKKALLHVGLRLDFDST